MTDPEKTETSTSQFASSIEEAIYGSPPEDKKDDDKKEEK